MSRSERVRDRTTRETGAALGGNHRSSMSGRRDGTAIGR